MWGIGGDVSQFAAEDIARMIAQQQVQQQMQQQAAAAQQRAAMEQARLQLDQRQFDQGVVEHGDRLGLQNRQLEETTADRRDRANRAGVSDMMDQRKVLDTEADDRAIADIVGQMPQGAGRRVVDLRRRGIPAQQEDVETPEERTTREAGDLTRIGQEADIRARAGARYREPRAEPRGNKTIREVAGADGTVSLVSIDSETGQSTPVTLPPGTSPSRPVKAVTGAERSTLAFYNRAKNADDSVRALEDGIAASGLLRDVQLQSAPNVLQTSKQQRYRQAQRAFTEARLRKESGAAINPTEYVNDARTYFAQPGDAPAVKDQKRKAREVVLDGLANASGRAWDEYYGSPYERAGAAPPDGANSSALEELERRRRARGGAQ